MLRYKNLIEFFCRSLVKIDRAKRMDHHCLETIRKGRSEALSFGQLFVKSKAFANYLFKKKSIQIGDKIAILGKNRADWDIAFWGVILTGAIPVLIDPERRIEGVKKHLFHTESKLLIMDGDYQDQVSSISGVDLIKMIDYDREEVSGELIPVMDKIKPNDTAVILCTSGTTGDPREVELTHANLIANLQGSLEIVKISSKDVLCHILPPHHSFGLTVGKLLPFSVGATNIYTDRYHQIAYLIKSKKVTIFIAMPALFKTMAKKLSKLNFWQKIGLRIVWRRLRFCISGSARLSRETLETFWKTGIELYEGYGTTENSPVYGFNSNPKKLGSVGKPIFTLSVKIVDGEILLGGPCIMRGYYKNPEATAKAIEIDDQGIRWLHTGDLGHLDSDGCLYITGRKKYMIVLPNGKNVYPELVESVLSEAKYVKEILVIPFGEEFGALVLIDKDELTGDVSIPKDFVWHSINQYQHESQELSSFEMITSKDRIKIVKDFERTSTGKIKRELYIKTFN